MKQKIFAETCTEESGDLRGELQVAVEHGHLVLSIAATYVMGIDPYHARLLARLLNETVELMEAGA